MKLVSSIAAVCLAAHAGPARAACDLSGVVSPASVNTTYDPFAAAQTVLDFKVRVKNKGDAACQARLFIRPGSGGQTLAGADAVLIFRIDAQQGAGSGQAGEIGPFVVQVPARDSADIPVRTVLGPQQIVPRGLYSNELSLRLEAEDGTQAMLAGGVVRLRAQAQARTEMSISGSSGGNAGGLGSATIDFGEAQVGKVGRVFVNVWSNGSVAVSLSSENSGVLRLVQNPALQSLPYSASFDGTPIALSGAVTLTRTPPMTLAGASYELALTLGQFGRLFAGQYKDLITVTVNQN